MSNTEALMADPKFQKTVANVEMLPGEQVFFAFKADGYFLGANPLLKLFAKMQSFFVKITGGFIRVYLMVTNKRVILVQANQIYCGMATASNINAIGLASIREVGMSKVTQLCCIHTRSVHLQSLTQPHSFVVTKLGDEAMRDFVSNLSAVLVSNAEQAKM